MFSFALTLRQKCRAVIYRGAGFALSCLLLFSAAAPAGAQSTASAQSRRVTMFLTPRTESVMVDSTFEVSVYLNSRGQSINAVELNLRFTPGRLAIVNTSGGKSFISLWVANPTFSNTKGTVTLAGITPGGIVTEGGLITTLTFQAKAAGTAVVEILPSSRVLANDGAGSEMQIDLGRGIYTIEPKPPEGVKVFSETHPFETEWYNNPSPVFTWEKPEGVTDFSFVLDNKPATVPDNEPDTADTIRAQENLADGLWFFHIKARRQGVWGAATHFRVHIDTTPPAQFTPQIEVLRGADGDKALVSFFTTDSLSGLDQYEVGVIDLRQSPLESPLFVEAESPYQLPVYAPGNLRVVVRARDRAGNVRDEGVDVSAPPSPEMSFVKKYIVEIYIISLALILLLALLHYLFGHRVIAGLRRAIAIFRRERKTQEYGGSGGVAAKAKPRRSPARKKSRAVKSPSKVR